MVQVGWTAEALSNVEAIRSYWREFNPHAADRIAGRLLVAGESLADLPERGRRLGNGTRQLVVAPYILTYGVEPDRVVVLRVRHGARRRT